MSIKISNKLALIPTLAFAAGLVFNVSAQEKERKVRKFEPVKALPSSVNSDHEESYPLLSPKKDVLYFVRTFTQDSKEHKKGEQDIFFSKVKGSSFEEASNNLPKVNNKFNNAVVGLSKDGNKAYVLNQYPRESYLTAKGMSVTEVENGTWQKPNTVLMPKVEYKGNHYGVFVSTDETVAIFSIDNEQTKGAEDLYVSHKDETGAWSDFVNLGTQINTGKAEFAPFLSEDKKTLYFSSYGHAGEGDADIFVAERLDNSWTNWSTPTNLGEPINTKGFDAYFTITKDNTVYFASTRGKNKYSDIYTTKMSIEIVKPEEKIKTIPVDSAQLAIDALVKAFEGLNLIHFEFNKSNVQPNDALILDAVCNVLKSFPQIQVTLTGHTDNIGSDQYNEKLSEKRVKAALKYMEGKGIDTKRVTTQAFGEAKPVEANTTPKGRAQNRRVEIILKSKK